MSKMLLYCTKGTPYLYHDEDYCYDTMNTIDLGYKTFEYTNQRVYDDETGKFLGWANYGNIYKENSLNGKIVAECDFKVEKIRKGWGSLNGTRYFRSSVNHYYPDYELEKQSCLSFDEINNYLKGTLNENCGYAIHIKNLKIFDEPRDITKLVLINQYRNDLKGTQYNKVKVASQNMCMVDYAIDCNYKENIFDGPYILISIQPQWLCKILNGEKTIEVRKKVLKEMLGIVSLQNY